MKTLAVIIAFILGMLSIVLAASIVTYAADGSFVMAAACLVFSATNYRMSAKCITYAVNK